MLGKKLYPDLEAYIDHNYVRDKNEEEYEEADFKRERPAIVTAPRISRDSFSDPVLKKFAKSETTILRDNLEECKAVFYFEEEHESKLEDPLALIVS